MIKHMAFILDGTALFEMMQRCTSFNMHKKHLCQLGGERELKAENLMVFRIISYSRLTQGYLDSFQFSR